MLAYYNLYPFPEERADLRHAIGTTVLHNCHAARGSMAQVEDYLLKFGQPSEAESAFQGFKAFAAMQGKLNGSHR